MAMSAKQPTFSSAHFPYIPVTVILNKRTETVEALLDTGFDGDLIIPEGLMTNGKPPDSYLRFTLADQETSVLAPAYLGRVEVAELGDIGEHAAIISVLGTEAILGRNLARYFHITLDHGREVRIRP
jgi:predicted aspartyl protease